MFHAILLCMPKCTERRYIVKQFMNSALKQLQLDSTRATVVTTLCEASVFIQMCYSVQALCDFC